MEVLDEKLEYEYNNDLDTDLEIIEDSSVYVLEDAIPDVLSLNDLNNVIIEITAAKDKAEGEKLVIEENRKKLDDEIGTINNGKQIQEVAVKVTDLRDLDLQLDAKKKELESIYANLRKQEEDRKILDITTRRMVEEMTKEYNELVRKYTALVDKYRKTANFNYYDESNRVIDELGKYKEFKSFEDILKSKDQQEEAKEEVAEQKVEETEEKAVEAPEAEKAVVTELSEVKVDSLPEAETKEEEKAEEVAPSEPVKAEVTPIVEEKVAMPTFEELLAKAKETEEQGAEKAEVTPIVEQKVEENKPEVTAEVPETPVAEVTPIATPEVKPEQELKIAMLTSKNDKIAETKRSQEKGIKEVFANSKPVEQAKTLEKAA